MMRRTQTVAIKETALFAILVKDRPKRVHKLLQIQAAAAVRVGAVEALLERENLGDGNRAAFVRALGVGRVLHLPPPATGRTCGGAAMRWPVRGSTRP